MAQGKKSFILYTDLYQTVALLDNAKRGQLLLAILEYVNNKDPKIDDLVLKVVFEPIKQQLKRDLLLWNEKREKRRNAGRLGGLAKSKQKLAKASNAKQDLANLAVNVNVNGNKKKYKKKKDYSWV